MILYRVSNHTDLSGMGGELADGRWHTRQPGRRIVYLADHPALCLLEMLVHLEREQDLPQNYQLLSVEIPDTRISRVSSVPANWIDDLHATRKIGDLWLDGAESVAMLVPSAVAPRCWNCLFNPRAPSAAGSEIKTLGRFPFNRRLRR